MIGASSLVHWCRRGGSRETKCLLSTVTLLQPTTSHNPRMWPVRKTLTNWWMTKGEALHDLWLLSYVFTDGVCSLMLNVDPCMITQELFLWRSCIATVLLLVKTWITSLPVQHLFFLHVANIKIIFLNMVLVMSNWHERVETFLHVMMTGLC